MVSKRPAKRTPPRKKSPVKKSPAKKTAAKKTAAKKTTPGRPKLTRAHGKVVELLKHDKAGTLTRRKLQTGLKEIHKYLRFMDVHIHSSP
jgi:hypothetical protein